MLVISFFAISASTASAQEEVLPGTSGWWMNDSDEGPPTEDPTPNFPDPNPSIDLGNGSTVTGGQSPDGVPYMCIDWDGDGNNDFCYLYPGGTIDSVDEIGDWIKWQIAMIYHLRALYGW